jgi:O-antigen/teichoic acid export membrane protein
LSPDAAPRKPSEPLWTGLRRRFRAWAGEPGTQRRILARNGAWESGGFLLSSVVLLLLNPVIVRGLGDSLYGVWEIIIALTGYLSFADFGVRPAAVHFIARYDARKDVEALNRFVNTSFVTFAGAGLLILVVATPLAFLLPRFWDIASGFETEASIALVIVAVGLAGSLPLNAFSAVLVGKQRYDRLSQVSLAALAVRTTLILLVLAEGWGLLALAIVVAGTELIEMAVCTLLAFRLEPRLRFAPRLANRDAFMRLLRFGGWATAVIIAIQVVWATDALVIGHALSAVAVTFFAIGFKLAFYARELPRVSARVLEPAMARLFGLGDTEAIRRTLTKGVRVTLLLAGPVLVYLVVMGKPFLRTWQDGSYVGDAGGPWNAYHVLLIMTLAVLPAIASAPLVAVHYGTHRVRPLALLMALEAVLNLGLSIALVGPWGINGVAWGTAIPAWIVHGFLLPWGLCRQYGISFGRFFFASWVAPLGAGAATFVALGALTSPDTHYGWPMLIGLAALAVVLYGLATLLIRFLAPALLGVGEEQARMGGEEAS